MAWEIAKTTELTAQMQRRRVRLLFALLTRSRWVTDPMASKVIELRAMNVSLVSGVR